MNKTTTKNLDSFRDRGKRKEMENEECELQLDGGEVGILKMQLSSKVTRHCGASQNK